MTQLYDEGACVYFYYMIDYSGLENYSKVYAEIEEIAREEIMNCGGSLSHHHGVGKVRAGFMGRVNGAGAADVVKSVKAQLDPMNVFGVGNGGL